MKPRHTAILVVDDDLNDQRLIAKVLDQLHIPNPVRTVEGSDEAIRYLNGDSAYADRERFPYPTIIMSDLKMQLGDGLALLENLKANPRWAVIPTIIFSGSADLDDIKKVYMLGASTFLVKPSTLEGFRIMMKKTYEYWDMAETPESDETGQQLPTHEKGKLGERFPSPDFKKGERDTKGT